MVLDAKVLNAIVGSDPLKTMKIRLETGQKWVICSIGVINTYVAFYGHELADVSAQRIEQWVKTQCVGNLERTMFFCDKVGTRLFRIQIPIKDGWSLLLTEKELMRLFSSMVKDFMGAPEFLKGMLMNLSKSVVPTPDKKRASEIFKKIVEVVCEGSRENTDRLLRGMDNTLKIKMPPADGTSS